MSLEKIRRTIAQVREMLPACPGPCIEYREGTAAELAAWPEILPFIRRGGK
jgi:hypothetical protein